MHISLTNVSRTFGREVVFHDLSHAFPDGSRTAILGPNGSGKSTLLQVIAGALRPTSGKVVHTLNGSAIEEEEVYRNISIAAPYLGLYEDLSLREAIALHARFKPLRPGYGLEDLARITYLEKNLEKPVLHFSSGMKQRLKLALAILSDTPLLLLDEPTGNLDSQGIAWFRELLTKNLDDRTLLIASNRQEEGIFACSSTFEVERFK